MRWDWRSSVAITISMSKTLFTNGNLLLDDAGTLHRGFDVLVNRNRIEAVGASLPPSNGAIMIDLGGRTPMPGLIDAHAHITGLSLSPRNIAYSETDIIAAAADYLHSSLMDGFTTIREAGGAGRKIAQLLAQDKMVGPRLFYSGRALTQTGGGADFRTPDESTDAHGHVSPLSVMSVVADGVDEVRRAAREELRRGATQLKIFASGGVVFPSDAHATLYEYSLDELRAVVEEASSRGTYVMAHAYTDEAVRRCLQSGIRSIEHGNYVNEETVAIMAERGAFIDPTFISLAQRIESASATGLSPMIVDNLRRTLDRGRQVYTWARRQGVPIGFGTDLWGADARRSQLREFEMRMEIDDSVHIIRSATTINAELLMQKGTLGTIAPGACADLLVIDGDPLSDLKVMTDPRKRLKLIMNDGHIVKNEL